MSNIVILGASGMLGTALQKTFRDVPVVACDKDVDITDRAQVQTFLEKSNARVVINAAAYTNVDEAEDNEALVMRVNAKGPGYIAEVCSGMGVPLLHVSTSWVFDGKKQDGYTEADTPNPISVYGASKFFGEQNVASNTKNYYIVRTDRLYGDGGKNIIDTFAALAQERQELSIVSDQYGSSTWSYDLATAIRSLLESNAPYGVYHLANEGTASWYDLAQKVVGVLGTPTKLTAVDSAAYPRKANVPQCSALQNTKAPKLRPWEEAVSAYLTSKAKSE